MIVELTQNMLYFISATVIAEPNIQNSENSSEFLPTVADPDFPLKGVLTLQNPYLFLKTGTMWEGRNASDTTVIATG